MGQYVSEFTGPEIDNAIKNVTQGKAGIQGVKVNGTEIIPDSTTNKVDLNIPTVSQTTGTSTTSTMSQNAITNSLNNKQDNITNGYIFVVRN